MLRTSAATSHVRATSAAAPRIAHCHRDGPPETRTSARLRQVGDPSPEVERLAVVGKEQAGLDLGEAVANQRPRLVFGLEGGDAGVDEEPARRTGRVEVTPRGHSVGAGVGSPAGGLISRRDHGGLGDEGRHPGRGLEREVRILDRRPPRQRKQPIAIHTRLAEEVGQDRQRKVALELMVVGVGQDGDPDPQLGQPPQVGEEPEPSTAMLEEIRSLVPAVPAVSDHAERVTRQRVCSRRRDGLHLGEPLRVEHDPAVDRASVQLEPKKAGQIRGAGVEAAGRRHRHVDRRLGYGCTCPTARSAVAAIIARSKVLWSMPSGSSRESRMTSANGLPSTRCRM